MNAFDACCDALEAASALDRLQARGTVRIALKQAGLDASRVRAAELSVVIDQCLPAELQSRGIADVAAVCERLHAAVASVGDSAERAETPETVFARLGS